MKARNRITAALCGAAAAAGGTFAAAVSVGPESISFPQDYRKWTLYATVDRRDSKQYRELYTSAEAVKAVREGRPIPEGTVIVSGKPIRTAVLLKGQSASVRFDEAGTFGYICGLHPAMKGTVEVAR